MEFKLPELSMQKETTHSGRLSGCFGSVTPKSMLCAINKSLENRHLDSTYSEPSFGRQQRLLVPIPRSDTILRDMPPSLGSDYCLLNDGLSRVYAKLSRIELEQSESEIKNPYKMLPKREPRKKKRKPFNITAYAKDFMSSVASSPHLKKSRTNMNNDFLLKNSGKILSSDCLHLQATSLEKLLQNSSSTALPVPVCSPSETGRILLPAMKSKGKKIKNGDPCFLNRYTHTVESLPTTQSLQSLRRGNATPPQCISKSMLYSHAPTASSSESSQVERAVSKQHQKKQFVKIATKSSTKFFENQKKKSNGDVTKRQNIFSQKTKNIETEAEKNNEDSQIGSGSLNSNSKERKFAVQTGESIDMRSDVPCPPMESTSGPIQPLEHVKSPSEDDFYSAEETLPNDVTMSTNENDVSLAKDGDAKTAKEFVSVQDDHLKFPKRRKLEPLKYRLPKTKVKEDLNQHVKNKTSPRRSMLPPITISDPLVSSTTNSNGSSHSRCGANDADDERESSHTLLDRSKKYRKQVHYYSSGSDTEEQSRDKAGKRRKKRKQIDKKIANTKDNKRLSEIQILPPTQDSNHSKSLNSCGDEGDNARTAQPQQDRLPDVNCSSWSKGKNLRNRTSESKHSIISRYITDMTRRGHIVTSDPEDGDDELEDEDYDFSKVSMT
ncbi:uncharacterized protein LOC120333896 isoform X1 [Styela clava]